MVPLWMMWAVAQADPLTFEAVRVVEHGKDVPRLVLHVGEPGTTQAVADCSGRTFRVRQGAQAGSDVVLRFDGLPAGVHDCRVDISFVGADGADGGTTLTLQVVSLPANKLTTTFEEVVTARGEAVVHAERPLGEATATLIGARGVELGRVRADLSDDRAPRFTWDPGVGEVVKIVVEAQDEHGLWSQLELLPWSYAIPHVDVVFETGSDVVRAEEVPKLQAAWAEVVQVEELYGSVVEMRLFVAGYTDTVGDAASNQALSERRARSIARWFREQGFRRPIAYQGFGEDALAVGTPDGTDEARNRRALYVLCAQQPPTSPDLPRQAWKAL